MMKKLQLGFIGAGAIARAHMTEFSKIPNVSLRGVSSQRFSSASACAKDYEIEKTYERTEDLLRDREIDAVVLSVPNALHAPFAIQALQAGKHVLLEKPMAMNAEEAKAILKVHQGSGKVLMIGHHKRWESIFLQIKEEIVKGTIGQVYYAKAGHIRRHGIPGWGSWFTRKDQAGGGALIDIGVHMLDLSLWLMDNPKPRAVFGSTFSHLGPQGRGKGPWGTPDAQGYFNVDEMAASLIKFDNGTTLSLEVSWALHTKEENVPFISLYGTKGGVIVKENQAMLITALDDRKKDIILQPPMDDEGARLRLCRHFIECIQDGKEPETSGRSGLTNNLIIDAIYLSAATGREVALDWNTFSPVSI